MKKGRPARLLMREALADWVRANNNGEPPPPRKTGCQFLADLSFRVRFESKRRRNKIMAFESMHMDSDPGLKPFAYNPSPDKKMRVTKTLVI
jgi:hypothetical protein